MVFFMGSLRKQFSQSEERNPAIIAKIILLSSFLFQCNICNIPVSILVLLFIFLSATILEVSGCLLALKHRLD